MAKRNCIVLLGLALTLSAGCEQVQSSFNQSLGVNPGAAQPADAAPAATAPAAAAPGNANSSPSAVASPPVLQPPGGAAPPATAIQPSAVASPIAASPPSQDYKVSLSAGVALAQTLPDGTAMGFSVDYQFNQGGPNQSSQYAWVIVPGRGKPIAAQVQLEDSGTLQNFFPGLKPEDGPFQCFIAEVGTSREPKPISATVRLK